MTSPGLFRCLAAALLTLGLHACTAQAPAGGRAAVSSTEVPTIARLQRNRRAVERYFGEVWNRGRLDVLDDLLAPDYVNHTPSTPDPAPGPAGLKPIVAALRLAFPDLHYSIEDIVVTEDKAVVRVTMTGTHLGALFGLPPTGRRVRVSQVNIERFHDGRIVEHWRVTDELALMRQLGAVP
jgi:steroid delta-isomerase-like uncharacterized protein